MRTHVSLPFLLMLFLLSGCAKPALHIPEPTNDQLIKARQSLKSTVLSDFTLPGNRADLTTAFEGTATRVAQAGQRICARLVTVLKTARCRAAWTMPILYTEDDVNAFADEHDRIGVYTGLVQNMGVEAQLAAVLAHEYSHVMLGHVEKKANNMLTGAVIGGVLTGVLAGKRINPRSMEAGTKLGMNLGSRAYSPEMEIEADRLAVYILQEARYSVFSLHDSIVRLHRLKASPRSHSGAALRVGFLETHPSDDRRIAHLLAAARDAIAGKPLMVQ